MGYRHFKVKVGHGPRQHERQLVREIRQVIGQDAQLWLDANGAWSLDEAVHRIDAFSDLNIAWIEQPTKNIRPAEMAQLRAQSPIPIGLDEDLTSVEALNRYADAQALDVAVIKPMFVGGLMAAQRMIRTAHDRGIKLVITSALESNIGRMAAAHLAAGAGPDVPFGIGHELLNDPTQLGSLHAENSFFPMPRDSV